MPLLLFYSITFMNVNMDYYTIKSEASNEFIERRSKFIGYVKPVKTVDDAVDFVNSIKAIHRQATHNVYAYSLREGHAKKFSDDGEPQGTAGLPVLDVLTKEKIVDAAIVVTRYFGGTLLGTGGLVRAYSKAAKLAVQAGEIIRMSFFVNTFLKCDYNNFGKVSSLITKFGGVVDKTDFSGDVKIEFHINEENVCKLENEISQIMSRKIILDIISKSFYQK